MVMRFRFGLWLMLLCCLLSTAALSADPPPEASVDRSELRADETLTLTLRVQGQLMPSAPELAPLRDNFQVLGSRQSSQHRIVNGSSRSLTEWQIELAPNHPGVLTIPALDVGGGQTQPLSVKVTPVDQQSANQAQNSASPEPVFVEAEVDHKSVYVQQQLLLSVRIFQAIQLDDMQISEPEFDHADVRKLDQTSFQRQVGSVGYRVHELVYAIFPQQPGELIIPELVFNARQPSGRRSLFNLNPGVPVRKLTPQLTVTVKPIPAAFTGSVWLPATRLTIAQHWSQDPPRFAVGESLTRTLRIRAQGLPAAQLPELRLNDPIGARLYADQPQLEDQDSVAGVAGERRRSMALIPTQQGTLKLPAVRIPWWNVETDQMEVAELPAQSLNVAAGQPAVIASSPPSQAPRVAPSIPTHTGEVVIWPWQAATAVFAALWLATLALWWGKRPHSQSAPAHLPSESLAWRQLKKACAHNDAQAARTALLVWAGRHWPEQEFPTLQAVAQHCGHSALSAALQQLEQHLYGRDRDQPWRGQRLLEVLNLLRRENPSHTTQQASALPPLNP